LTPIASFMEDLGDWSFFLAGEKKKEKEKKNG
jgi:hypothetical protein